MTDDAHQDDPSIPDSDRLFRRVPPNQIVSLPDGTQRPSSANFKDKELSVNIESLMKAQNREPQETLNGHPGFSLTSIIAGRIREYGYPIVKDVEPPNDPAHGLVLGNKKDKFAKVMATTSQWVVPPAAKIA